MISQSVFWLFWSGSACKFPSISSVFHCQWLCRVSFTPFLPPRLPELTSQELLPEICWNTFLLKAVTGMLAWQASFFSSTSFLLLKYFAHAVWIVFSGYGTASLHFFYNRTKMLWLISFYFYHSPVSRSGRRFLCCCQTFKMAGKTPDSASSVELLVTVHSYVTSVTFCSWNLLRW